MRLSLRSIYLLTVQTPSLPEFEHELGSEIFRKFIELEPAAKDPLGVDLDDIEKNSERFQKVTKKYFEKLDLVIDMLGT